MKRLISFLLILTICVSLCACGKSNVAVYREVFWGMTQETIEQIEGKRGNTVIEGFKDGKIVYTMKDIPDLTSEYNRSVYFFEGENDTLSSFMIGSAKEGNKLVAYIVDDLEKIYGKSEYNLTTTKSGAMYENYKWETDNETIEGIALFSSLANEAYFTFTMKQN